ncbi:hypothetical protein EDD17DRAFT_1486897 [Pisolithus thermaeus]|nr:hypothetical protein EDD17DRAFT_1486897 [Pisolithus thermaeus]
MDPFSSFCCTNLYYPFSGLNDWEMANFLLQSKMSMVKIDEFLSLGLVCPCHPFYSQYIPLISWFSELLPTVPCWDYRIITTSYPTKSPATLYFCDSLKCIEALFNHPYYADHMMYTPF